MSPELLRRTVAATLHSPTHGPAMRLCRFLDQGSPQAAFFFEDRLVPLAAAALQSGLFADRSLTTIADDLLAFLPGGVAHPAARRLYEWVQVPSNGAQAIPISTVQLLVPIPRPNKLLLLAGNYADHIREGGGVATERAETFPYVFMKPASTTLTAPGNPVTIPAISPHAIDWELELAVVIGRTAKGVSAAKALDFVAGYTIINDISNRRFQPNPKRKERPKDAFFDWLHGKWHDSFCPCGPCITSAETIPDPQTLPMQLKLNGQIRQEATTGLMIFPVSAIIEFISSFVTLEPGDIISTGTPAGVGSTTGTFVKPGDVLTASIGGIGVLESPMKGE